MLEESREPLPAPRIYAGGRVMRRDDELLRRLMLDFEASDDPLLVQPLLIGDSAKNECVYYHLKLLADTGLLEETGQAGDIFRMTSAGHDFCGAIRDTGVWEQTREAMTTARKIGVHVGLGLLRDIALGYARHKLRESGIITE